MNVTNIRICQEDGHVLLKADCTIRRIGRDTAYFKIDKKYREYIFADASPFAAALLIPAMYLGEDLIIDGPMSRSLYDGMQRIMEVVLSWNIGLKPIRVHAKALTEDVATPAAVGIGSFFSGGVDSFYTYLKHKDDAVEPISHLLLIKGNDIDLQNANLWNVTRQNIQHIADAGGIDAVTMETNLQSLLEPIMSPDFTHGGCLAAVGLCLRNGFRKIYIPSTFSRQDTAPWGSHPDIDWLWSTHGLTFEHDGVEATRLEKVEWQIAKSPLALKYLRVCYYNKKGAYNCGKCEKCLRTMIALYVVGRLGEAETFPHDINLVWAADVISHAGAAGLPEAYQALLAALEQKGLNAELQEVIRQGLARADDPAHTIKDRIFKAFVYFDHMYLRGKLFRVYRLVR